MNKDGVIIKAPKGKDLYYYKNMGTREVLKKREKAVRTLWSDSPITVGNKYMMVTVYPDGTIQMDSHDQVKAWEEKHKTMDCVVYHIHPELEDKYRCTDEGYIGITTKDTRTRWEQHLEADSVVGNAIRNQLLDMRHMTVIFRGAEEECRKMEKSLRPVPNSGWNVAVGG